MGLQGSSTLQGDPWATTKENAISQVVLYFSGHRIHVLKYKKATVMLCSPLQAACVKSRRCFITPLQKWYTDFTSQGTLTPWHEKGRRELVL